MLVYSAPPVCGARLDGARARPQLPGEEIPVDTAQLIARRCAALAGALLLAWGGAPPAGAQSLSPRAYVITPADTNLLLAQYAYADGNLQFNGAVPITGATATVNTGGLGYYHAFSFLGRSANFDVAAPYSWGDFKGTVFQAPKETSRTGFLDATARLSVNLIGGPAMSYTDFGHWQQTTLLGASLTVVAPTGQYDATKLINFGGNRWAFKPELGYSRRFGNWVLDGYGGVWFFTTNSEFFSHNRFFPGTQTQSENTVEEVEGHISYDVSQRLWISLDANYWWGGSTSLNGHENPDTYQKSSRVGVTASIPLTKRLSLKFSYANGAYIRYGGNYQVVAVALQYGWIGWRFH